MANPAGNHHSQVPEYLTKIIERLDKQIDFYYKNYIENNSVDSYYKFEGLKTARNIIKEETGL
jgi:hypothetical protein